MTQRRQLYQLLQTGNSVAGWRHWCIGNHSFKCCVSWTNDCYDRRWVDALALARSMEDQCGVPGAYIFTDIDPCFGRFCLSNNEHCH